MKIQFQKKQDKPSILRCIRADGSTTWTGLKTSFDVDHDLTHYIVESTLNLKQAFYGLLKSGIDINDWTLPKDQRPAYLKWENLPIDAQYSEIIVGVFQRTPDENDFWESLKLQLNNYNLPPLPELDPSVYKAILLKMKQLRNEWRNLEVNDTLEFEF